MTCMCTCARPAGSLIFGLLLDRIGVRAVFAINFLSAAAGYYLLSITTTLSGLYLAKVPGIALCGFLCAQTAVCKLTEAGGAARLQALGRLTTSYTIGGVVGPYLGGVLSASYGMLFSAKVAAVGSLLAAALVSLLPAAVDEGGDEEQKQKQKEKENTGAEGSSTASRVGGVLQLVWLLLFVRVFTSISNSMSRSAQPLILKNLGCDVAMLGLVKSLQMGFGGFANAFLLQPLKQLLSSGEWGVSVGVSLLGAVLTCRGGCPGCVAQVARTRSASCRAPSGPSARCSLCRPCSSRRTSGCSRASRRRRGRATAARLRRQLGWVATRSLCSPSQRCPVNLDPPPPPSNLHLRF
jgi:MFS family permease